ncbi:MAG: hypothetical protein FWD54_06520 [Endomicrobia bacterium]|nr:hypothetical protein [Endomicrobiia bacterium]
MMKKTALVMLGMFVLSTFSFAGEGKFAGKHEKMDPEQKAKWEAMKKEKAEYFQNLQTLIDKYNKASDQDKPSVRNEITALVSSQTDKNLVAKREMLAAKKEEISEIEAKISEMETDKTAFVNKKVDFFLSEEGQAKIEKMKEKCVKKEGKKDKKDKKDKKNKTDKKDSKKDKSDKKSK